MVFTTHIFLFYFLRLFLAACRLGDTTVRFRADNHVLLLRNKRVVVWEFIERDIRLGTEGWQHVPLPPKQSALQTARQTE
jgi:hypothetical protein